MEPCGTPLQNDPYFDQLQFLLINIGK